MKTIELTNEITEPRKFSELMAFTKVAMKLGIFIFAGYAAMVAFNNAKAEFESRKQAYFEEWLDDELKGLIFTLDHKAGTIISAAEANERQLKKALYYNAIQLKRQAESFEEIQRLVEIEEAMGAKIFRE